MKNIVHIIEEDFSVIASGVNTVVRDLNSFLSTANMQSKVLSVTSALPKNEFEHKTLFKKGLWRYSRTLHDHVTQELNHENTVIHTHGVWMHPQYIANKIARKNNKPYVVTPHGMLEPWLFNKGGLKKHIYLNLMQQKNITNASVLHAITPMERDNLYALTSHKNIEVIPNLISTKFLEDLKIKDNENKKGKYILYLGRIDPKKGIDLLLKAFSKLPNKDILLKIAGPENDYMVQLSALAENLGISKRVQFLGCVYGDQKYSLYKNALVFVAPSHSEVIGMVNLEAGLMATPVITTFQTGILKGWNKNGGILINPGTEEVYTALSESVSWSTSQRNERGERLKKYIKENYSWEKNINKWVDLYSNIE